MVKIEVLKTKDTHLGESAVSYPEDLRHDWWRLWFLYNAIMLAQGLPCLVVLSRLAEAVHRPISALPGILFGIAANVCFCIGPLADALAYRIFGWRMGRIRYALFAAGLLFSMALQLMLLRQLLHNVIAWLNRLIL